MVGCVNENYFHFGKSRVSISGSQSGERQEGQAQEFGQQTTKD